MRTSLHVEPSGAAATARHYIRDLVYGANDGIITAFAVVSGVAGGQLSQLAVLVVGAANLAADGVSMGVGNFLAIRADERARETEGLPELERHPWKHGLATLLAFVVAGAVPLTPYLMLRTSSHQLVVSTILTFTTLFVLGALRALVTRDRWWQTGLETLVLGTFVAQVEQPVELGVDHVLLAWELGRDGRKAYSASAIIGPHGVCGRARAVWVSIG